MERKVEPRIGILPYPLYARRSWDYMGFGNWLFFILDTMMRSDVLSSVNCYDWQEQAMWHDVYLEDVLEHSLKQSSINSTTSTACRTQTELTAAILRLEQARVMSTECRSAKLLRRANTAIYSYIFEGTNFQRDSQCIDHMNLLFEDGLQGMKMDGLRS